MKKAIAGILFMTLFIASCEKDKGLWYSKSWEKEHPYGQGSASACADTAGTVSYANKVVPILQTHCSLTDNACHSNHGSAGGNLTTWASVSSWCQSTPPYPTTMENDINQTGNPMPKTGAKLSQCDIAIITKWIKQGALNN